MQRATVKRYAVISDIHGNRWALETVLDDIKRKGIERIVNLGDSLYGPLDPRGTAEIIMHLNSFSVLGNEDRLIFTPGEAEPSPTLHCVQKNLGQKHIDWLGEIPVTRTVDDNLFACHASPHSDTEYFFWNICSGGAVLRRHEEMRRMASGIHCPVLLCGHDHVAQSISLQNGLLVVNPGSVGLPAYKDDIPQLHVMQAGSPHTRYAILSQDNAEWTVEHILLEYDWETPAAVAVKNGRQDWASWLRTGKAVVD